MIREAHLSFRKTHCKTDLFQSLVDKATGYLCPEPLSKNLILLEQKECRFSLKWLISAFFFYLNIEWKPKLLKNPIDTFCPARQECVRTKNCGTTN